MPSSLVWYSVFLLVGAFAGGMIALARRWSDDLLHLFISFGAGIFLGAVFFELLPEAMGHENRSAVSVAILIGFLLIFLIERFLFSRGGPGETHGHKVISIAAFIGLSVHSLIDGLGLAVAVRQTALGQVVFLSILAHHVPAAFSVASLLALARLPRGRTFVMLALFAAMPPIGALLFAPAFSGSSEQSFALLIGLMTGTFLYVATGDLLPEVFHGPGRHWRNLLLFIAGILLMGTISLHHVHEF